MALYWTRSRSFIKFWDVELRSCFPIKVVAGKCNPWLHFTPQEGLALGDRSGKISTPWFGSPVPPDLCSTRQEGHPSWFPLVASDWGIWASLPENDQDSCPGWLPPVPPDLVSPRRASLPTPLPLDLSASLPPEFCPLPFVCFLCGTWHRTFMRKHCQLEEFIKTIYRSSYCTVLAKNLSLL